jgi:hypothetical protein
MSQFPEEIKVRDKNLKILEYKLPDTGAYVVLETYSSLKSKSRIIHVLNFQSNDKVRVGRGQDADVRITDISVSRDHSEVYHSNGKFYQMDMNSKFGSVRSFEEPVLIKKQISIQAGKTVLFLSIKTPMDCCWTPEKKRGTLSDTSEYHQVHRRFPIELKSFFKTTSQQLITQKHKKSSSLLQIKKQMKQLEDEKE